MPEPQPDIGLELRITGQVGGASYAVATDGHSSFLGVGPRVYVVDVENPGAPRLVGQSPVLGGLVYDVALHGDLAFVAAGTDGLVVLDVGGSDGAAPAPPRVIGRGVGPQRAGSVAVHDGFAYVVDETPAVGGPVWVFDVSSPEAPTVALRLDGRSAAHVFATDTNLFVALDGHVVIYSLLDPSSPLRLAEIPKGGVATAAEGSWLYLLDQNRLSAYDLTSPVEPVFVGDVALEGDAQAFEVAGDRAYVVGGPEDADPLGPRSGWLRVVDLASLRQGLATSDQVVRFANEARDVAIREGTALVADTYAGLATFAHGDGGTPRLLGKLETLGVVESVAAVGDIALALTDSRLVAIDASDHERAVVRDAHPARDARAVSVVGDKAYLSWAFEDGVPVVQVSGTGDLDIYGELPSVEFAASDRFAYVRQSGLNAGLHVYDMTGPDGPRDVARISGIRGNPRGVAGGFLYATDDAPGVPASSVTAYDLSDARRPVEAGRLALVTELSSSFSSSRAYTTDNNEAHPIELAGATMRLGSGRIPLPGHCSMFGASGTRLWTARSKVTAYDVEDVDHPRILVSAALPGAAYDVAPQGDEAYVADGSGGLVMVTISERLAPTPTATRPPPATATPTATSVEAPSHAIMLPRLLSVGQR